MISFTDVTEYLSHSRNWAENFRVRGILEIGQQQYFNIWHSSMSR